MSDYEDEDDDHMDYVEGEAGEEEELEEVIEGDDYQEEASAPTYTIPSREVVAVEHPMIIQNLENGIKTFGRAPNWSKVCGTMDPERIN